MHDHVQVAPSRPLMSRVPGLLRRHWMFVALLVLGLAVRVIAMVAYRPGIFYIDSVASYLLPLHRLDPTGQDPIGYDLILLLPVLTVANITTLMIVQHLLGLGLAVTGYALLVHKGAPRWLAALATVPVLLDAYQVQIEHNIMSEALFEVLLLAALAVLAWRDRPGVRAVIVAGLLLGASITVRQAGEPLVLPLVAYPLLAGGAWRRRTGLAALALACFALPALGYASYYHHFTGKYAISHVGGNSLYGRVATFADCSGVDLPEEERVLCPTIPRDKRPGPDWWAHSADSPYFTLQKQAGTAVNRLSRDFSIRIIRHQPLDFAAAVGTDSAKVFSWNRLHQAPNDPPVDRWQFQQGFPTFPPLVSMQEISMLSHKYGDGDPVAKAPWTTFLRGYQLHGGYTPGPVVALAVLLGLVPLLRWRRAGPARLPALLFVVSGALVLLIGDVTIFSWRYQLPGYVLLPIGGALGLTAVLRRRPLATAPAGEPGRVTESPGARDSEPRVDTQVSAPAAPAQPASGEASTPGEA